MTSTSLYACSVYIYIFFFSILLFLLLPFFTDFYRPYSVLRIEYDSHKDCITREKVKRECGEAGDPYFYRVYVEDLFLSSPHQLTALFGLSCRSYFFFFARGKYSAVQVLVSIIKYVEKVFQFGSSVAVISSVFLSSRDGMVLVSFLHLYPCKEFS